MAPIKATVSKCLTILIFTALHDKAYDCQLKRGTMLVNCILYGVQLLKNADSLSLTDTWSLQV